MIVVLWIDVLLCLSCLCVCVYVHDIERVKGRMEVEGMMENMNP